MVSIGWLITAALFLLMWGAAGVRYWEIFKVAETRGWRAASYLGTLLPAACAILGLTMDGQRFGTAPIVWGASIFLVWVWILLARTAWRQFRVKL